MRNTIIHGDCLDVMPTLAAGSVDMILADLPYAITKNLWDSIIPLESLWAEYWRILKPIGIIALTASQPFTSILLVSQMNRFKHEWVWQKNRGSNFANTVREPMKEHENVLIFSRGKWTYNKQMQPRSGGGVDLIGTVQTGKTRTPNYNKFRGGERAPLTELRVPSSVQKFICEVGLHPTQKPVALFEYLIRTYTNPGDLVLDNVAGSCTTAVACINTGRDYICIEKELEYVEVGRNRVAAVTAPSAQLSLPFSA